MALPMSSLDLCHGSQRRVITKLLLSICFPVAHGLITCNPDGLIHSLRSETIMLRRSVACFSGLRATNDDDSVGPRVFDGPLQESGHADEILGGASLVELGLDVCVAPSRIVPGGLGLFARIVEEAESVTVPAFSLLSGYSRLGSFHSKDVGDKTVGFVLDNPNTAVFFDQQLMSISDALELGASRIPELDGSKYCGLVGHELRVNGERSEGEIEIKAVDDGFERYFVPDLVNRGEAASDEDYNVQNFGQFCNDLAWDYSNPPQSEQEYNKRSEKSNIIQLIWRMELDEGGRFLKPSWPVSVFQCDVCFTNRDFMELGTRYGWKYWQTIVDLQDSSM